MTRYTKNYNGWGDGKLNAANLSAPEQENALAKTNGVQGKRWGPLGGSGIGGVVRKNGSEHEIVYELAGDSVLEENGVGATGVLLVELPDSVGRVESAVVKVQEAFAATSSGIVNLTAQATAGDPNFTTSQLIPLVPLDVVGIADLTLGLVVDVFEEGGSMTFDFTNVIPGLGKAEIIVKYTSL